MSVPRITPSHGEMSDYSEGRMNTMSPAINLQLQLSCKDSTAGNEEIPIAFRPRPKISRTPPITNDSDTANIHITIDNGLADDDNTEELKSDYFNDTAKMNSPSLSIEYPPGSTIPVIKKRKKFQFKKSHYQKFIGTSSAKKTKEIRKIMMRDRSRSNSLISYQSSNINSFGNEKTQKQSHHDMFKTPQQSIPPSPPSDDIISTLSQMMNKTPNKLPHHISTNSTNIIMPKMSTSDHASSEELTVSSSPSLIEERNTTTRTHTMTTTTTTTKGYGYQYRTKQQWTTFVEEKKETTETKKKLASTRSNYRPKKTLHNSFGSGATKMEQSFDPDRIRMALSEYEQQKGQNLEEIFRPKKSCCYCAIL